jgi:Rrf2 family transcriptional regulator, cysteine metabolism repressor
VPLFSAKLDYALRAVVDLALQPPAVACQSREIASRQDIRGPYLDQILAVLKREGIVRSIRGAGGGYTLARSPQRITVGDVVRAVVGSHLLVSGDRPAPDGAGPCSAYTIRQFQERMEAQLAAALDSVSIADLASDKQRLDESLAYMPGF